MTIRVGRHGSGLEETINPYPANMEKRVKMVRGCMDKLQ